MRKVKQKVIEFIKANGGYIKPRDLKSAGYDPNWVYLLQKEGDIERIRQGLYKLTGHPVTQYVGFIEVSRAIPKGVICLRSALSYHQLTTYNPSKVDVALPRRTHQPKSKMPPVQYWIFSERMFLKGIIRVSIDGTPVRVYNPEKTICDCFRFRNKIGIDLAKEGLKEYLKRKNRDINKLLEYAEICRIKSLLKTYLEAIL
jgi:predicted transcriptional regulator of viral defense system